MTRAYLFTMMCGAMLTMVVPSHASAQPPATTPAPPWVAAAPPPSQSPVVQPPPSPAAPPPSPAAQTPPAPAVPAPSTGVRTNAEALALIARMQQLLDGRESDDGKTLKMMGKVTLDRSAVDELTADLQQLKFMLQR